MEQPEPRYARVEVITTTVDAADAMAVEELLRRRTPPPPPDQATLAEWMPPELLEAWEIIVRDLETPEAIVPMLVPDRRRGADSDTYAGAGVRWEDGRGAGISVTRHQPLAERVVQLADQFQEHEVEALWYAGRSAVWPDCPRHPNTHPLNARVHNGVAVWSCGGSDVIAPIGELFAR
jgi:hypothetical protein